MKSILVLLLFSFLAIGGTPSRIPADPPPVQDTVQNPVNIMMKDLTKYRVAIFWKGPGWGAGSQYILEERAKESKQIRDLVKRGVLLGIVRVSGDEKCKLVAFLKTDSKDEAEAEINATKVVQQKILTPEIYTIWGSKGMGAELRKQVEQGKKPEKRQSLYLTLFTKFKNWNDNAPDDSTAAWATRHATTVLKWKESGALKFYGIVDDVGPLRVMGIFSEHSLAEAKERVAAAPSVRTGKLAPETYMCSVLEGVLP